MCTFANIAQELLAKYHGLLEEFSNVKSDWLSERDVRKVYQKSAGDNEIVVNNLQRQLVCFIFVLTLFTLVLSVVELHFVGFYSTKSINEPEALV